MNKTTYVYGIINNWVSEVNDIDIYTSLEEAKKDCDDGDHIVTFKVEKIESVKVKTTKNTTLSKTSKSIEELVNENENEDEDGDEF